MLLNVVYMVNHFVKYWSDTVLTSFGATYKSKIVFCDMYGVVIVNNRDIVILELVCDLFTIEMDLRDI